MTPPQGWSDHDIVARIGLLLRVGVIASALVMLAGGGLYLYRHGHEPVPDRRKFTPEPAEFSRPGPIVEAALQGRARSMIQLGLLLLIATPITRVAFSIFAFARQRDVVYVLLPLLVLLVLTAGFVLAPAGR